MAPKKPPQPPANKPGDPPKGEDEAADQKNKPLIETVRFGVAVGIGIVVFFILDIVMLLIFIIELVSSADIRQAMYELREFAIQYDGGYQNANDEEIIALARKLINEFNQLVKRNDELKDEIDYLSIGLHEWKAFQGNLYLFADDFKIYRDYITECQKKKSEVVMMKSEEEKDFVEDSVTKYYYWVGIRRNNKTKLPEWFDGTPITKTEAL